MPVLTAITAFSVVIWKSFGQWRSKDDQNKLGKRQCMKQYREEFVQFFPTVLSILMNRKTLHPRAKLAYDHLEEVGLCIARGIYVAKKIVLAI